MQVLNQEAVANLEKYWVSMAPEGAHSFTDSEIAALHPFPQALQPGGTVQLPHSNLYVKNLSSQFTEAELVQLFSTCGLVEAVRVVRHSKTQLSKLYGFVKMAEPSQALSAIEQLNGVHGLEVRLAEQDVGPAHSGSGLTPSDNVYVRNLPAGWSNQDLMVLFQQFGAVQECRVLHAGDTARGAGALVRMGSVSEAAAAIERLNGSSMGGSAPLLVRYADTPEEKARKMAKKDSSSGPLSLSPPQQSAGGFLDAYQQAAGSPLNMACSGLPAGFTGYSAAGLPDPAGGQQHSMLGLGSLLREHPAAIAGPATFSSPLPQLNSAPQSTASTGSHSAWDTPDSGKSGHAAFGSALSESNAGQASAMVAAAAAAAHIAAAAAQQQARAGSDSPSGSLSYSAPFSFAPQAAPTPLPQAASMGALPHFGGRLVMPGGPQQQPHSLAQGQPQQQISGVLAGLPQTMAIAGLGPIGGSLGPPPRGPGAPCSLYIKNLPSDANELFLYHRFAPLGAVLSVKVLADEAGRCRGVGFVNYRDAQAALEAIQTLNGSRTGDKLLHVSLQTSRMH